MGARYLDQVGGHKPCVPVVGIEISCPRLGPFLFCHVGGGCHELTSGPPMAYPRGELVGVAGTVSCSRSVLSERCWSTRMGAQGHVFCGVGTMY